MYLLYYYFLLKHKLIKTQKEHMPHERHMHIACTTQVHSNYHNGRVRTERIKTEARRWYVVMIQYSSKYVSHIAQWLTTFPYHLHLWCVQTKCLVGIIVTSKKHTIKTNLWEGGGDKNRGRERERERAKNISHYNNRGEGGKNRGKEREREREYKSYKDISLGHQNSKLTKEKAVAWNEECPKGSICHPTTGRIPNVLERNLSPKDIWSMIAL